MSNFLIRYILLLLVITTISSALEDEKNKLNLQTPKKLNQIEGKKGILKAVKKDEVVNKFSNIDTTKPVSEAVNKIDTSSFQKVKLIDVILETLSNSDLLKSSREKVIQYEIKVKNAIADYYPKLDFEYTLGKTRSSPSGTDGIKFKYFDDDKYKFVLSQNIYSGGATTHNLDSVVKRLEVAKNQYRATLDDEIKKAIKAYFDVVFADRSVMVNERNMKKLNKVLKIVSIKYENGAASIGDLTSIKANVANAKSKLVKVQSKFIEALSYYEYIAGIDFEKTLPYEKNFNINVGNFDEIYKKALEKNRDLINYYKTIEVEKFNQKKAEASFKPKVDFELSYTKTMEAEDLEDKETDINGKVKLSYNIFNGGKDKNKVLENSSKIRDLKHRLSEEKKKLKWNLSKIFTSIQSVNESIESTITEIKASRKMVAAYWDAFKLGEQDLNTLLQGQRQLNSAETELVGFEKSHITSFFNILELTGNLSSFFDVDPESPRFIDFSKSDYKKIVIAKDGDSLSLDKNLEMKKETKKDLLKEEETKPKDIPLPQPSINENINNFIKEFKNFDDESYMIEISSFGNIYESFDFIKENNLDTNSFSYDVLNKLNIETRIAHNNFTTKEEANSYLNALKEKNLGKDYKIRKVKDIKSLYENYKNGLKVKPQKPKIKIKTKVIEKVRQPIKKQEFLPSEVFKNKFLSANANSFTINVSSFTNIDKVEEFVNKNKIYDNSFFFRYGNNGEIIKLINGIYKNYSDIQNDLNTLTSENKNLFPVVEKIALVRKLYEDNIEFNTKKEEILEYEYIDISKENKTKYPVKTKSEEKQLENKVIKAKEDKSDDLLTVTKRPSIDDIYEKKKEDIKKIREEINEVLSSKKEYISDKTKEDLAEEKRIAKPKVEIKEVEKKDKKTFEKKFIEAAEDYYTSNLASFDTMEEAKRFVKKHNIEENTILVISNSTKIMVMSGIYAKRDEALKAIEDLPKELKRNKPFIQKIFRTQDSYKKNNLKEDIETHLEKQERIKVEQEEELRLKKIEEEKQKKLAEEKRIAEEKARLEKQKLAKEEELRLAKLEEEKQKKLAEEKRIAEQKVKEAEEKRILEEKAEKEALRLEKEKTRKIETCKRSRRKINKIKKCF